MRKIRTMYHLVPASSWPFTTALSVSILLIGLAGAFHLGEGRASVVIVLGLINLLLSLIFWFGDVIKESVVKKKHTLPVIKGLRLGFILFIVSEAILFASFFGAYFYLVNYSIGSKNY